MPQNTFKQYATATSGTITVQNTQQDVVLIQNGAGVALAMTISFPANPVDGQRFTICSGAGITTLTLSGLNTILGGLGSMAVGGFASWIYDSNSSTWYRIG